MKLCTIKKQHKQRGKKKKAQNRRKHNYRMSENFPSLRRFSSPHLSFVSYVSSKKKTTFKVSRYDDFILLLLPLLPFAAFISVKHDKFQDCMDVTSEWKWTAAQKYTENISIESNLLIFSAASIYYAFDPI